jgi:hypothetical protein
MLDYLVSLFRELITTQNNNTENPDPLANLSWGAILVDMQEYFVKDLKDEDRYRILPSQKRVIHACRRLDLPLAILEYANDGETLPELRVIISEVPRHKYITKSRNDGFKNKELHKYLQTEQVNALLFMGMNASCCVLKTAKHARKLGYTIATSIDLIANEIGVSDDCSVTWYERNGIYKQRQKELLEIINAIKSQEVTFSEQYLQVLSSQQNQTLNY